MTDANRVDALLQQMQSLHDAMADFCRGCRAVRVVYETEEYWGARCRRPVTTCPADLEPGALGCTKAEGYEALEKRLETLSTELDELRWADRRRGMIGLCDAALERVGRAVAETREAGI